MPWYCTIGDVAAHVHQAIIRAVARDHLNVAAGIADVAPDIVDAVEHLQQGDVAEIAIKISWWSVKHFAASKADRDIALAKLKCAADPHGDLPRCSRRRDCRTCRALCI